MAKYTVKCPECGTGYTVQLYGRSRDREWKLDHYDWTCDECKEKARQQENEKAAEMNAEAGLPALTGSPKQIAWAETIRASKLENIEKTRSGEYQRDYAEAFYGSRYSGAMAIDDPNIAYAESLLKTQTLASWWIDNRQTKVGAILQILFINNPPQPEETDEIKGIKNEAMIEATVRPENPETETVAEIRAGEKFVEVDFPEKREDFREIVRYQLGYSWTGALWRRNLTLTNGTSHDRAAELGNHLLAAGFPIRIYDDTLRVHAVCGTYEPESKRWIVKLGAGKYSGWFGISWPKGEDFYSAAKKIRGSRYEKPHIVVPIEHYQEILDFADLYEFSMSPGALDLVEQAKGIKEKALTASVKVPEKHNLPQPGDKPAELPVPETVEIDEEFLEEV